VRLLRAARAMYFYCRDGHGYPNSRGYSLRAAISWAWRFR
jgi:hypothetical protein